MLNPRIMSIVKITVLVILRNIFNGIQVVLKSLEHNLGHNLLFFELSSSLFYKSLVNLIDIK